MLNKYSFIGESPPLLAILVFILDEGKKLAARVYEYFDVYGYSIISFQLVDNAVSIWMSDFFLPFFFIIVPCIQLEMIVAEPIRLPLIRLCECIRWKFEVELVNTLVVADFYVGFYCDAGQ